MAHRASAVVPWHTVLVAVPWHTAQQWPGTQEQCPAHRVNTAIVVPWHTGRTAVPWNTGPVPSIVWKCSST